MNPQVKTLAITFIIFLLSVLNTSPGSAQKTEIELKNGFYYINHQKFFVKGIGYEVGAYPGMLPWNRPFNETILRNDMNRIKEGGYNTIRTWNAFTDQEMKVVQDYGLKIIMGIWIDPAGDFSDSIFVKSSLQLVSNILSYTSKYDNIIGYLIMNEPLPDHIFSVGFQHTYTLWMKTKRLIHEMHPGIPVSFANTCVGDFIDPLIFDFSAYNIYPYNPSTVNHSFYYPEYVRNIYHLRNDGHPLVVTEFGLSVSPSGEGNWGYGGNSIEEQTAGILYMVRSLIDGGAGGACVFNYSDGWWKAGDEYTHNDAAEEWFGLVEYKSVSDKYGTVRPVWDSLKNYNRAVIISPKNQAIYNGHIPVEIFSDDTIAGFTAGINGEIKIDTVIRDNYFSDTIRLNLVTPKDIQMIFTFYDAMHHIIKKETIQFLGSDAAIQLPAISIAVTPLPLKGNHLVETTYSVVNNGPLQTDSLLDYSFYTHIGWDYGVSGSALLTSENNASHTISYSYSDNVDVITLSAGLNVNYGSFTKRIVSRKDFIIGDTTYIELPTSVMQYSSQAYLHSVYPNPASDFITIGSSGFRPQRFYILESRGRIVAKGLINEPSTIDIHTLTAGYYVIILEERDRSNSYIPFIKDK